MESFKEKLINEYIDSRIAHYKRTIKNTDLSINKVCYEAVLSEIESIKELMEE